MLVIVIKGGVRFPLDPLLRTCLKKWHICPCQLMPNGFKIIMGVAKLNRILGINLSVHDIEDVYDLCKSGGGNNTYYLRVKAHRQCFVNELEHSNRYAGDDRLFVSGNWEFGESEVERPDRVPRGFGTPPSKHRTP